VARADAVSCTNGGGAGGDGASVGGDAGSHTNTFAQAGHLSCRPNIRSGTRCFRPHAGQVTFMNIDGLSSRERLVGSFRGLEPNGTRRLFNILKAENDS